MALDAKGQGKKITQDQACQVCDLCLIGADGAIQWYECRIPVDSVYGQICKVIDDITRCSHKQGGDAYDEEFSPLLDACFAVGQQGRDQKHKNENLEDKDDGKVFPPDQNQPGSQITRGFVTS